MVEKILCQTTPGGICPPFDVPAGNPPQWRGVPETIGQELPQAKNG